MATNPTAPNLDPGALLEAAPEDEFAVLELRLDWPYDLEIHPRHAQLWLRCFVLTKDPLSWIANRGEAWTAVTLDGEVLEVDLYLTLDLVRRTIQETGGDLASAVGRYASAVMQAALEREEELLAGDYPDRAVRGETPRLLDGPDRADDVLGAPAIQAKRGWSPVGLGALTDLVQHAFGHVDLDRSNVVLDPVEPVTEGCPACDGHAFGYPSSLEEAKQSMCEPHVKAAVAVNTARLLRARESNFAGWRAVDKAAMRVNKAPEPSYAPQPPRIVGDTPARNDPCPCGSGKKYKRCHGA